MLARGGAAAQLRVGTAPVSRVYRGAVLLWQPVITKTGGGAVQGTGSVTRITAIVIAKAGGGASRAAGSGTHLGMVVKTARAAGVAAGSGSRTTARARFGGAVAMGVGSGTHVLPGVSVKTGGGASRGAGTGARATSTIIVKTGGGTAPSAGVGTRSRTSVRTGGASGVAAGTGARISLTNTKSGGAAGRAAGSGPKLVVTATRTGGGTAPAAGTGARTLTFGRTGGATGRTAGSGPRSFTRARTGGAAARAAGSGARTTALAGGNITSRTATKNEFSSVSSIAGIIPTGTAVGELMTVFYAISDITGFTAPAGWAQLIAPQANYTACLAAYYRVYQAGDAAPNASFSTAGRSSAIMQTYQGVHTAPIATAAVIVNQNGATTQSLDLTISPALASTRLVSALSLDARNEGAGSTVAIPTGMNLVQRTSNTTGQQGRGLTVADATQATAATLTRTWTQTGTPLTMTGFIVALRSAPSGFGATTFGSNPFGS